jgi:hypothetical protein
MKCKHCGEIIPIQQCQQGGYHMKCYNEELNLVKVEFEGSSIVDFRDNIPDEYLNEIPGAVITNIKMSRGEFENLPEFEGF